MARRPAERMPRRAVREVVAVSDAENPGLGFPQVAALFVAFAAVALLVYAPALRGPFVSDDLHYVATNPYVHALSLENVRQILDPWSPASIFVVNYTPVHLLLHALQWHFFGPDLLGYHVTNVLLHALGAALLAAVFRASGIGRGAAVAGGALFLLHPVNVEAVAWVSQLKTSACFVLSMAALLAFPRRPLLATPLFFLALLAKPTAAFLLPVAAVLVFVRLRGDRPPFRHLAVLAFWLLGFALLSVAQVEVNRRSGAPDAALGPEGLARLPMVLGIALRYLWMSASSFGVSAFHEPAKHVSFSDPWFLLALPVLAALGVRTILVLKWRREEAVYWVWAAASFAPVSQIFPFLYPMADRYLYFILPGLLGGTLLALRDLIARRLPPVLWPRAAQAGLALAVGLAALFAVRSHERAEIWRNPALLLVDAARNYPDGVSANLLRAKRAAREGDPGAAIAALRAAEAHGWNRFEQLESDPAWDPLRADPRFRALVRDLAGWWIARSDRLEDPTQMELRVRALAHRARGENAEAAAALEAALARGGPIDDVVRQELEQLRRPPIPAPQGK